MLLYNHCFNLSIVSVLLYKLCCIPCFVTGKINPEKRVRALEEEDAVFWSRQLSMSTSSGNGSSCECVVKIGVDGLTPSFDGYNWTTDGVNLWLEENSDMLQVGGTHHNPTSCQVEIISMNSEDKVTVAVDNAHKMIDEMGVLAIVGLEYSTLAIPVGEVANQAGTPMIATTASAVNVTRDRPFVFRISFVDTEQGPALAKLGASEFNATTAAIIYKEDQQYSSGLAKNIKDYWEYMNGVGSVVSYVSFNQTNVDSSDYSTQAVEIANSTADVLFVPVNDFAVSDVVTAIYNAGWRKQILGGDDWSNAGALENCSQACVGALFTANFIAEGSPPKSLAKDFVDKFTKKYNGLIPQPQAALAYDAMNLIQFSLSSSSNQWTCEDTLEMRRQKLRDDMDSIKNFPGVAGEIMTFDENQDPFAKCIAIGQVTSTYVPTFYDNFCPGSL